MFDTYRNKHTAGPVQRFWLARFAIGFALLMLAMPLWAQQGTVVPKLSAYFTDLSGTFDAAQRDALDARLREIDQRTGSQVVVVMVPSIGDTPIEQYSLQIAETNQIGRKKISDGVLLLVAKNDRKARIEVGYGLEGAIPDITAGRIIREYMGPKFRQNDYVGGINDAVGVIDKLIVGEQLPAPMSAQGQGGGGGNWIFGLFVAFIVAQVVRGLLARSPAGIRGLAAGGASGTAAWWISSLISVGGIGALIGFFIGLASIGGGRGGGRYVGSGGWGTSSGGWGGGGSFGGGGGGFSGGGGSFGGGGASGSW